MGLKNNPENDIDCYNQATQEDHKKEPGLTNKEQRQEKTMPKWTFYKAGWRPALGWLSVLIIFWAFLIHPALTWYIALMGYKVVIPAIDATAMLNLVAIVIGVGAMRTYEKTYERTYEADEQRRSRNRTPNGDDIYN